MLNFPGGTVQFTPELNFIPDFLEERMHCYRALDENGEIVSSNFVQVENQYLAVLFSVLLVLAVHNFLSGYL